VEALNSAIVCIQNTAFRIKDWSRVVIEDEFGSTRAQHQQQQQAEERRGWHGCVVVRWCECVS